LGEKIRELEVLLASEKESERARERRSERQRERKRKRSTTAHLSGNVTLSGLEAAAVEEVCPRCLTLVSELQQAHC